MSLQLERLEDRNLLSTVTVTNTADSGPGSLRQAIADAQSGDTIRFDHSLNGQTITLTSGEVAINKSLDIDGPGTANLTISGNNASRVFDISGGATNVEISGLTIENGLAATTAAVGPFGPVALGGALLNTGAHVSLSHMTFEHNQALGSQTGYVQTNLVSDIPGLAQITDPQLKNPWGIALSPQGPFTIADEPARVSTSYAVTDAGVTKVSPTISFPTAGGKPLGPTGMVYNNTSSFLVNGTPASFIYAAHNPPPPSQGVSVIAAWNPSLGTTAQVEATIPGAVYTGLDLESTRAGDFLYAANPFQNRVDVFDSSFKPVTLPAGAFVDPELPMPLVPFNIEGINGNLYVAYAPRTRAAAISAPDGAGAVAEFDTSGHFIRQLTAGGKLAAPWGMTLAPASFGEFGGALLIANFSYLAPEINAFDPVSGEYLGTLTDSIGNTLLGNGQGIWDMSFGNGGNGGLPGTLYVATGLNNENDGLFAAIDPAPQPGIAAGGAVANIAGGTLSASHVTFADNEATAALRASGGAIANDASTLVLDHSTVTDNQAITSLGSGTGIRGNALSGALYNAGGSDATVSHDTFENNSAHGGNGADGVANAPNGQNAGTGVGGAVGNEYISLLGAPASSTMTIDHSSFIDNEAIGGTGGNGAAGGNGGNGSSNGLGVAGGAINNGSSTLTVSHSSFIGNEALGGSGGNGGVGGNGGAGVNGAGGGISSIPTPSIITGGPPVRAALDISDSLFLDNQAIGGRGGNGGTGGNGGNGGAGQGGGLRTGLSDWNVANSVIAGNQATGGAGGDEGTGGLSGGNGGAGQGGGIFNFRDSSGTLANSLLVGNEASGGTGGLGGNGGNGQGGGAYNDATSNLELLATDIVFNSGVGGAAGTGGNAGQGMGGGLYLTPGGTACADARTAIFGNYATTSDDDVFGTLGAC